MSSVNTWISVGAGLASVGGNWSLGHSPGPGEIPTFDSTSDNNCSWDISNHFDAYAQNVGYTHTVTTAAIFQDDGAFTLHAGTFVQGAFDVNTGAVTMDGGTLTGVTTNWWTVNGNVAETGGTLTTYVLCLKVNGNVPNLGAIYKLECYGSTSLGSGVYISRQFIVDTGSTPSITGTSVTIECWNDPTPFTNNGIIGGPGPLILSFYAASRTMALGTVNAPLSVSGHGSATGSSILSLAVNTVIGSTVSVVSNHATYTMTLNLAGYSLSATTITASTRGMHLISVAGAKLIAGTGGITVAANGTLDRTNISYIESRGNVDLSAGTSVMGKERWVIKPNVSGISLKLGAGQKFYDLLIETVKATLLSNVTVNRIFAHVNPLVKGAYTHVGCTGAGVHRHSQAVAESEDQGGRIGHSQLAAIRGFGRSELKW